MVKLGGCFAIVLLTRTIKKKKTWKIHGEKASENDQ